MKTLQNNFTTPEQSKRLLGLGVPENSADCYTTTNIGRAIALNLPFSEFIENIVAGGFNNPDAYLPSWSVGRLMEIIRICNLTAEKPWVHIEQDNIRAMITAITDGVNNHMLDFSKLEDYLK